jgi:antitoxin (DNA-binding transcriptional repressor) of toxin-antitoxin stability system
MKRVRISDLKSHLSEHLRAAESGETIEVLDRARAIVRLVPVEGAGSELELIPASKPFRSVRGVRLPAAYRGTKSLDALREERGSR